MNQHQARRKRRRAKQKLKGAPGAVRKHARKTGRTGRIWCKRTKGKVARYQHVTPNPAPDIQPLGGPLW